MGRFIKNHRPALLPAILQDFGALFFIRRQKTFKAKPSGRKPRHRERRDACSRTRQARHPDSCFQTHPHEHLARIGDRRRPRIRNQRNIREQLNLDNVEITEETSFKDDLDADSLDLFELVMAFEEAYNVEIPSEDLEKLETVGDVMDYIRDKEIDA